MDNIAKVHPRFSGHCPLIWVFMICDCRKREPRKRSWRRNMEFTVSATTITGSMGEGYWKDRCARSWKAESRIFLFAYVGRTKIGRGGGMGKTNLCCGNSTTAEGTIWRTFERLFHSFWTSGIYPRDGSAAFCCVQGIGTSRTAENDRAVEARGGARW